MVTKVDKIWLDGKFIDWDKANVHVLTSTLHYGLGVFEGIRCYELDGGGSAVFRLKDHIVRLYDSAHMFWIKIPYSEEEIVAACKEIFRVNKLKEGYLRPLVFLGAGAMGLYAPDNPVQVCIAAWTWGTYLGEEGVKNGIRAKVSSYARHAINANFPKSKACGNYINSMLAKREAIYAGYEEALMVDQEGYLAEATGENIFIVRNGLVRTPPRSSPILNGITRDCILTILKNEGIATSEERILREDAYTADEVFLTGTAAEVTPVREIDNHQIGSGKVGKISKKLQTIYFDTVRGKIKRYKNWLDVLKC